MLKITDLSTDDLREMYRYTDTLRAMITRLKMHARNQQIRDFIGDKLSASIPMFDKTYLPFFLASTEEGLDKFSRELLQAVQERNEQERQAEMKRRRDTKNDG